MTFPPTLTLSPPALHFLQQSLTPLRNSLIAREMVDAGRRRHLQDGPGRERAARRLQYPEAAALLELERA